VQAAAVIALNADLKRRVWLACRCESDGQSKPRRYPNPTSVAALGVTVP